MINLDDWLDLRDDISKFLESKGYEWIGSGFGFDQADTTLRKDGIEYNISIRVAEVDDSPLTEEELAKMPPKVAAFIREKQNKERQ